MSPRVNVGFPPLKTLNSDGRGSSEGLIKSLTPKAFSSFLAKEVSGIILSDSTRFITEAFSFIRDPNSSWLNPSFSLALLTIKPYPSMTSRSSPNFFGGETLIAFRGLLFITAFALLFLLLSAYPLTAQKAKHETIR